MTTIAEISEQVVKELALYRQGLTAEVVERVIIDYLQSGKEPLNETSQDILMAYGMIVLGGAQ